MKMSVKSCALRFRDPEETLRVKNIECVKKAKILGVTLASDLKGNDHVYKVIKKVHKRLYFLSQLKRAQVKSKELTTFYITCIRPVMEYA